MLALLGSGEYLPAIDPIDSYLINQLPDPPRVVCLATAAGQEGPASYNNWLQKGVDHFTRLGAQVTPLPVIDIDSAHNHDYATIIRQANFVYLSGGHPGYLATTLAQSPVWDAILSVHHAGGVVAGCSAGAMIMGTQIWGPGGQSAGFGLLPNTVIIPHFNEFPAMLARIMRLFQRSSLTMIGIDGYTALLVANGRYHTLGRHHVTIFNQTGSHKHPAGPIPANLFPSP
ncbi:MAG TPA: Type 1 glutamine amidotransferase-like domain-containing protein [Anaerolineae bacterium]|nr:Type 1 glutamine amidotransferase-like domain-containing protein [Anaerolineae bacterium]